MGGEAVAQTVSRQRLVDVSGGERLSKYLPHGIDTDMSLLGRSWKEPFFGSTLAPVLAQKFQQALREDRVAFAVALSERGYKTFCVSGVLRDYRRTHGKQDKARNCIR